MKLLLKSLLAGIAGSALFFFFFMMATIATMSAAARLNPQLLQAHGVVVMPAEFLRHVGLPLSAVVFALSFVLARRRFRRNSR